MSLFEEGEVEAKMSEAQGAHTGVWEAFMAGYDATVDSIVRPQRRTYERAALGPTEFRLRAPAGEPEADGELCVRVDGQLSSRSRPRIEISHWRPAREDFRGPCIVFAHANTRCRGDALALLQPALAAGASVLGVDLGGCGRSGGDVVTNGWAEAADVEMAVRHAAAQACVDRVVVWGHSMGAAAALLCAARRRQPVAALVLDSPFPDLESLVADAVATAREDGLALPWVMVAAATRLVCRSVAKRSGCDPLQLRPAEAAADARCPALFLGGADDRYVLPEKADAVRAAYAGPAAVLRFAGGHYTPRPAAAIEAAVRFAVAGEAPPRRAGVLRAPADASRSDEPERLVPWAMEPDTARVCMYGLVRRPPGAGVVLRSSAGGGSAGGAAGASA